MSKKILILILAGVVVIVGVVLFLVLGSSSDSYYNIQIMDTMGGVTVGRDSSLQDAYEGMKMRSGDNLKVMSDGLARINCDRETYSRIEHDTEVAFMEDSSKKLVIDLKKGEIVVEVQKKYAADEALEIKTSNTTMAIRGTVVAVRTYPVAGGGTRTINYVLEGRAVIKDVNGDEHTLDAGHGWLTVTDIKGNVTESHGTGAADFEFKGIDINSLRGADDTPMIVNVTEDTDIDNGSNGLGNETGSTEVINLSDIPINEANFPDPAFRQFISESVDTDKNGILSVEERSIDRMQPCKLKIEDLSGIEFFPELKILYCNGNKLTSLDISHNTNLTLLECQENLLTELDISKNQELKHLICGDNKLTSIDISKNLKLEELNIKKNKLTSLDTSINTALCHIRIDHNDIAELDLSNNANLADLFCLKNKLTSLDVTHNPRLTYLDCGSNALTELDLSKNENLRQLSCHSNKLSTIDISHNVNLIEVKCDGNGLTELDTSKNVKLTTIQCNGNNLTGLDLSNNANLKYLSCKNNEITSLDLSHNTEVTFFNYDEDKVTVTR
ncbi:MAG: leucine-rich repeat domain-containing protein [Lachnospiraceae bacterium]|nr:leucine-rich repeat domain-containing protein [Lachnospiraceae bacterium]